MKKCFTLGLFILLFVSSAFSQAENTNKNFPYSIGPFITMKGGVNAATVYTGIKNGFAINGMPDFGATGYIPLTKSFPLGFAIDLAYSTYCYDLKFDGNETVKWTTNASYLTLGPNLYIGGFTLGFNFGIPVSAGLTKYKNQSWDVTSEQFAAFFEFRIGGMIPVYYDDIGRLNIIIQAGYFLTSQYKEDKIPAQYINLNTHPASASLGLNYLFNLNKPKNQ